ncbi:uncharacterized protein LOC124153049 isoform X2 [Haliotis rufescens]|uniref:uncharacterized protein LOC124153049 isoform X2 n=1 Tax=Haliotis rufescens TaxID=6454 RepID=UPI001EB08043|nr:uncharacterized protein LOC124153049 isoform X2 [Haliotis rufescens]
MAAKVLRRSRQLDSSLRAMLNRSRRQRSRRTTLQGISLLQKPTQITQITQIPTQNKQRQNKHRRTQVANQNKLPIKRLPNKKHKQYLLVFPTADAITKE